MTATTCDQPVRGRANGDVTEVVDAGGQMFDAALLDRGRGQVMLRVPTDHPWRSLWLLQAGRQAAGRDHGAQVLGGEK